MAETEETLARLKGELVSETGSMLVKEIVDTAASQAVDAVVSDRMILASQPFIDGVAQSLAVNHRQQLRGDRGTDADDESVARYLTADPDFLNRVSVGVLLQDEQ